MNYLFIGYWNLFDSLTVSTIFPSLELLRKIHPDSIIVFANVQREPLPVELPEFFAENKIIYKPLNSGFRFFDKVSDFYCSPRILHEVCNQFKISRIIARGAPAGAIAYLLWRRNRISFFVESFEPHSEYMVESRVWKKYGVRYIVQRHLETKQKKYAKGLMPVAENYAHELIKDGVNINRVKVVPCVVNERLFSFNEQKRVQIRRELGIAQDTLVGIYVGKFGGLYLSEESFMLYQMFFKQLTDFFLIILSPFQYHHWIYEQLIKHSLPLKRIIVKEVEHKLVGEYCSASDFALATYKSGNSMAFLSPVKIGEYWVNGLPIILTQGVGDESRIIEQGLGGVLFKIESINPLEFSNKIEKLIAIVKKPNSRQQISKMGLELRSMDKLSRAYKYFFKE